MVGISPGVADRLTVTVMVSVLERKRATVGHRELHTALQCVKHLYHETLIR